ncbi:hypothetical protein D3C72_1913800 [compost metagenome]
MKVIARNGLDHRADGIGALERVGYGDRRKGGARSFCQRIGTARQQGVIGKGAHCIVDHHVT